MILGESCRAAAAKLVGTLDSCIRAVSCGALAKEKALGNPGLIPVVVEAASIQLLGQGAVFAEQIAFDLEKLPPKLPPTVLALRGPARTLQDVNAQFEVKRN